MQRRKWEVSSWSQSREEAPNRQLSPELSKRNTDYIVLVETRFYFYAFKKI
jgi:hypothetical protein